MKKNIVLAAVFSLFALALSVSAQKAVDYSGTWTLDVSKSKLDERARIESMTMTVTQTAKDIKIDSKTVRAPRPEGAPGGVGGGTGTGRGGGFGNGDATTTYLLDGKEMTVEQDSPLGKVPVKLKANVDGDKLKLSSTRTFNTPNGEITAITRESWSLAPDAKTLTVQRDSETPRGTNSSTMVFTKK